MAALSIATVRSHFELWLLWRRIASVYLELRSARSPDARIRRACKRLADFLDGFIGSLPSQPEDIKAELGYSAGFFAAALDRLSTAREGLIGRENPRTGRRLISPATQHALDVALQRLADLYAYALQYRRQYCTDVPPIPVPEEIVMTRWVLPWYAKLWLVYIFGVVIACLILGYPVLRDMSIAAHNPQQVAALLLAGVALIYAVYTIVHRDSWQQEVD